MANQSWESGLKFVPNAAARLPAEDVSWRMQIDLGQGCRLQWPD